MAHGEARAHIARPAGDIIEFILDLRQYQKVDAKLGKIDWVERDGNVVTFKFRPKLLGLPGPATKQKVVLSDDRSRIDIGSAEPAFTDKIAAFAAFFRFEEADEGTWVTRRVTFTFPPALAWLLDRPFGKWLAKDVPDELAKAKAFLESGAR